MSDAYFANDCTDDMDVFNHYIGYLTSSMKVLSGKNRGASAHVVLDLYKKVLKFHPNLWIRQPHMERGGIQYMIHKESALAFEKALAKFEKKWPYITTQYKEGEI